MKVARVILMNGEEVEIEVEQIQAITISDVAEEVPVPDQPIPAVAEEVVPDTPAPAVMEELVFEDVPTTSEETVIDTTDAPVESLSTPVGEEVPVVATTPVETTVVAEIPIHSEPVEAEPIIEASPIDDIVDLISNDVPTVSDDAPVVEEKPVEPVQEEPKKEETRPVEFIGA